MISRFFCAPFHFTLFFVFLQLSLFFDILLCLAENITESAFVDGERSGSYGCSTRMGTKCSSKDDMMLMKAARNLLWKKLRGITLKGGTREKKKACFLGTNWQPMCHSKVSNSLIIHEEKTKEITTVKEVWICDPNYHKNQRSFALIFSKNY